MALPSLSSSRARAFAEGGLTVVFELTIHHHNSARLISARCGHAGLPPASNGVATFSEIDGGTVGAGWNGYSLLPSQQWQNEPPIGSAVDFSNPQLLSYQPRVGNRVDADHLRCRYAGSDVRAVVGEPNNIVHRGIVLRKNSCASGCSPLRETQPPQTLQGRGGNQTDGNQFFVSHAQTVAWETRQCCHGSCHV